eukprot:SAG11_NODE_12567_length_697_cov_0.516722_1_plen_106_part_10
MSNFSGVTWLPWNELFHHVMESSIGRPARFRKAPICFRPSHLRWWCVFIRDFICAAGSRARAQPRRELAVAGRPPAHLHHARWEGLLGGLLEVAEVEGAGDGRSAV